MPRRTKEEIERGRQCSVPGCTRPWASTFNGRLCALHNNPPAPSIPVPMTPPVKPWCETEKDE
jgi:hypothetical protein